MRPSLLVPLVLLLSPFAAAQQQERSSAASPARGATVSGVVHDSLARAPLAGARVQLASSDDPSRFGRTVVSDVLGRFEFGDVPDGRYTLGFFHPTLDSLGLEPTVRPVSVAGARDLRADLAIPSPARILAAVCGPRTPGGSGVVMGMVGDARGLAPAAGVAVVADWVELSLGGGRLSQRNPSRVATTNESGWFAICDVPSPGVVTLRATRGADSTDRIETEVPSHGVLRRDLFLGAASTVVAVADSSRPTDGVAAPARRLHVGDGRVSGQVLSADGRRPLRGALVRIADGPTTRTDERGQWTIANAPAGTRSLEIRALGYYPERRSVHVIDDAPPLTVALASFKSVLETVKVTASYNRYEMLQGFERRSKMGMGRFLSGADIARFAHAYTSDIFNMLPGLYVDNRHPETPLLMRGLVAERCEPTVFLNGSPMSGLNVGDLDAFTKPRDLIGIEVYSAGMVPPQFQLGMTGCGSVVIWSR
jgi:hypothetical protein